MKTIKLYITTLMAENVPTPSPTLIADLIDAVLKTPGMRVASVEVVDVAKSATITRRVRNMRPAPSAETLFHGATASPGEGQ